MGDVMEKIVRQSLLFDFYGELLTKHQKQIYSDYIIDDIGISEIALEKGISRQGVHDLIKRCDILLEGYEQKLHLLDKFISIKQKANSIKDLTIKHSNDIPVEYMTRIQKLSNEIIEEL